MSRPPRRRRDPALLRGRFRILFFALLTIVALAVGHPGAAIPAAFGAVLGAGSVSVARRRGSELGLTFVVLDWLLLGCVLVFSGGADSWLMGSIPLLTMGQLAGTPRSDWPYLLAPTLLLLIVLAIADPSLGGSRIGGVAKIAVLVVGGYVAATRLRRAPARRTTAPKVDVTTGFYTSARLPDLVRALMDAALAEHQPLSVVYLRLEHYEDCRNFLGPQGSEEVVRGVARRIGRRLGPDDMAFRIGPDTFVVALPDRPLAAARELAADVARDVSMNLIAGRRQTLALGACCFPTVRDLDELLAAAREEALPTSVPQPVPQPVPVAAAQ